MKKSILSLCLLLVIASVTQAAPRFGLIGEQENGAGIFVTDDMYNFQLTVGQRTSDYLMLILLITRADESYF